MTATIIDPYSAHLQSEIKRLRAEADAMEQALEMYLSWKGKQPTGTLPHPMANGSHALAKPKAPPQAQQINKTSFVMDRISASGRDGVTTDDLWRAITAAKIDMTRDHLRSMLWHGVQDGRLEKTVLGNLGRYVLKQERPSA